MEAHAHHSQSFAWRADSFTSPADYSLRMSEAEQDELVTAVRSLSAGRRREDIGRTDFQLPVLGPRLGAAYEDVRSGRGFTLLRGLPVERLSVDEYVAAVWGIGLHFGNALSQNANGDRTMTSPR